MIRSATIDDVASLADVHAAALPDDFLPRLGRRYLRRRFYPTVLGSSEVDVFVVERSGELVALAVFVGDSELLGSALAADWAGIAPYLSFAVARHPSMARDTIGHLRGFDRVLARDIAGVPELYVMAVTPSCQSDGLGGSLLEHGLDALRARNQCCVVKTSSPPARRYYERHEFEYVGSEHRGARSLDVLFWSGSPGRS